MLLGMDIEIRSVLVTVGRETGIIHVAYELLSGLDLIHTPLQCLIHDFQRFGCRNVGFFKEAR